MESDLDLIKSKISGVLLEMNIVVDSVTFEFENKYKFLKIVLDKEGGIDLDTICEASKIINPLIDELDLKEDNYILDISSKERNVN